MHDERQSCGCFDASTKIHGAEEKKTRETLAATAEETESETEWHRKSGDERERKAGAVNDKGQRERRESEGEGDQRQEGEMERKREEMKTERLQAGEEKRAMYGQSVGPEKDKGESVVVLGVQSHQKSVVEKHLSTRSLVHWGTPHTLPAPYTHGRTEEVHTLLRKPMRKHLMRLQLTYNCSRGRTTRTHTL